MANYVVVDKDQLDSDLKIVADSIREKGETAEKLAFPSGMKEAIERISTGVDTSDANVISEVLHKDYIAYGAKGEPVVGTFTIDDEISEQDSLISQIQNALKNKVTNSATKEEWVFTMEDGSTVTKEVYVE